MLFKGKVGQFCFLKHLWIGYKNPDPPSYLELIEKLTSGVSACSRWWPWFICDRWGPSWGLVTMSSHESISLQEYEGRPEEKLPSHHYWDSGWGLRSTGTRESFLQSLIGLWLWQSYRLQGKACVPQPHGGWILFFWDLKSLYVKPYHFWALSPLYIEPHSWPLVTGWKHRLLNSPSLWCSGVEGP